MTAAQLQQPQARGISRNFTLESRAPAAGSLQAGQSAPLPAQGARTYRPSQAVPGFGAADAAAPAHTGRASKYDSFSMGMPPAGA